MLVKKIYCSYSEDLQKGGGIIRGKNTVKATTIPSSPVTSAWKIPLS